MAASGISVPARMTFAGVMAGEWLKLRKQRSFIWATLSALAVCGAVSALAGSLLRDDWNKDPAGALGLATTMPSSSVSLAALLFGLGLCVWLAGEFVSGSNYLTLLAVPRRSVVFTARLALVSILSLLFGGVVALIGTGAAFLFVGSERMFQVVLEGNFWASTLVTLLVCVSTAVLYFVAATLVRRSLPAVGIVAALFFVLPSVKAYSSLSGESTALSRILGCFPGSLMSSALMGLSGDGVSAFSPLGASLLLILWSVLLLAGAAWRFASYE